MKKHLPKVLFFFFLIIFIVSCVMLLQYFINGEKEKETFEDLRAKVSVEPPQTPTASGNAVETQQLPYLVDIGQLQELNSEAVFWLNIVGTGIDYPVMHTPNEPEKYLHRDFYGNETRSGTPFLDGYQSPNEDNIFIYGHNMKNGTMFGTLKKYTNSTFAAENDKIYLSTANGLKEYRVYAVLSTDEGDGWYSKRKFNDEGEYDFAMKYLEGKALFTLGERPPYSTQLLTLSTCRSGGDTKRLLIIAAAV